MCGNTEKKRNKIVLPDELQKEMLNFFMKTSIPRITRKRREAENELSEISEMSETKGQDIK